MNRVKGAMVSRTNSKRVVVTFAPASPHVGDALGTLMPARTRWLRDYLDEYSEATVVHMIENFQDRLNIDELAPTVPRNSGDEDGESAWT